MSYSHSTNALKFVVMYLSQYCFVKNNTLMPTLSLSCANTYPSRYAAKKHLRTLDNAPEGVRIVELNQDIAQR